MAEDWNSIAAEVGDALRSVGQTDAGFEIKLRRAVNHDAAGPNDWTPAAPNYEYFTLVAVQDFKELRDINGTLIDQTRHTLTVNATADVVPTEDMEISFGQALGGPAVEEVWVAIKAVRPLAPAGIAVLYEIDLVE